MPSLWVLALLRSLHAAPGPARVTERMQRRCGGHPTRSGDTGCHAVRSSPRPAAARAAPLPATPAGTAGCGRFWLVHHRLGERERLSS